MNELISLHHGAGGQKMHELIDRVFRKRFSNPALDEMGDAAVLRNQGAMLAFTTDSYVVDPLFFPGGDIGKLAVCGTLNDLSVSFSKPLALSASFILEEGFPVRDLDRIAVSMAQEAGRAGVRVVTGDTKVVPKGKCDKIFINTAGIGVIEGKGPRSAKPARLRPGDRIIVNGYLGDHAIAIMLARQTFSFRASVKSDCASLYPLISEVIAETPTVRMMRDVTRGGISGVLNEISERSGMGILLNESVIPVRKEVRAVCELLGFDPLDLANEGKFVAVVGKRDAERVVERMRKHPLGRHAAIIGEVTSGNPGKMLMTTVSGGTRFVEMPTGELLPRIC